METLRDISNQLCCACRERIGMDDLRLWKCGCYGHKTCHKEGDRCREHDAEPK